MFLFSILHAFTRCLQLNQIAIFLLRVLLLLRSGIFDILIIEIYDLWYFFKSNEIKQIEILI